MSDESNKTPKGILDSVKPIWAAILAFVDSLPYPRKYVFGAAAAALLVLFVLLGGVGGTSARDVARVCEAQSDSFIRVYAAAGDRRSAALRTEMRDVCCSEMQKAARQLSSYERDVVIAEMARGMTDEYSPNQRERFIQFFQDARNNVSQSEWQRMREPTSVFNQCGIRIATAARRG
ncbi:MAG: hypothetical protein AAGF60_01675 [Pseudomonadota bacterium]